ncbi:hypothetical protein MRB53_039235 [Persea americana]|nr:hypothetical protein MRB53_039235 [Persea americana]
MTLNPFKRSGKSFRAKSELASMTLSPADLNAYTQPLPTPQLNARSPLHTSLDSPRPSASSYRFGDSFDASATTRPVPFVNFRRYDSSPVRASFDDTLRPSSARSLSSRFKIPRRKNKQTSLFPISADLQPKNTSDKSQTSPPKSPDRGARVAQSMDGMRPSAATFQIRRHGDEQSTFRKHVSASDLVALAPPLIRHESSNSATSLRSSQTTPFAFARNARKRASTFGSRTSRVDEDMVPTPASQASGRDSEGSTTLGRNSIAGLRSLTSRLRHPSEIHFGSWRGSSVMGTSAPNSNQNSFVLSRDTLILPGREDGETAGRYYQRLEQDIPKKSIALFMSRTGDTFSHDVLRSLMRTFKFYEEPMDISLRRLLWEIDLPGEAQQIDRVIEAFANRYHECNPHIFDDSGTCLTRS